MVFVAACAAAADDLVIRPFVLIQCTGPFAVVGTVERLRDGLFMPAAPVDIQRKNAATAWLLDQSDRAARQSYRLISGRVTRIGRDADNDIVLSDSRCSRHHCEVAYHDRHWFVRDLGSRNGTQVRSETIRSEHQLTDGDQLQVGPHRLVFTTDPSGLFVGDRPAMAETDDNITVPSALRERPRITPRAGEAVTDTRLIDDESESALDVATGDGLIGETPPMHGLREHIRRVAITEATVMVRGESGVGKELVARAIHDQSQRSSQPFVCLNCAALNETLLESELFGHEKGAFTGATDRKFGKFELAHQGTLFLDEVGELSAGIQAKFLRVLEGQPYHRIGGSEAIRVDVRVVAATNRDLEKAVKEGEFRQDLYFRLHVVEIQVPPLRERLGDIPLLAEHFLRQAAGLVRTEVRGFTSDAIERLSTYHWPGNVRELKNVVQRAVIFSAGEQIRGSDLHFSALDQGLMDSGKMVAITSDSEARSLKQMEIEYILRVLDLTQWNKSRAAEILDIERSTLDRKLKRHNITRPNR
jgi:Nif-specific regulatory protein